MNIKPHGIDDLKFRFFNEESVSWYDPLKEYTHIEYEWVRDNCKLDGAVVVDAGCHHGNYSVVFKPAYVIAIDNIAANCNYAKANMELNEMSFAVQHQTLGAEGARISRKPSIYKCDIEGAEFELFPAEFLRFPSVKVWIVEIHPKQGNPNDLAEMFLDNGFELLKVDREVMAVRPYELGEHWKEHSTLIARKVI
jgi:hypothetical protein